MVAVRTFPSETRNLFLALRARIAARVRTVAQLDEQYLCLYLGNLQQTPALPPSFGPLA